MDETSILPLARRFKIGATVLNDPAPELPADEALKLYIPNYPFIAVATLGEPEIQGDCLVYPVEKPAVQTKGAGSTAKRGKRPAACSPANVQEALAALDKWVHTPSSNPESIQAFGQALYDITRKTADRQSSPTLDALSIPLA